MILGDMEKGRLLCYSFFYSKAVNEECYGYIKWNREVVKESVFYQQTVYYGNQIMIRRLPYLESKPQRLEFFYINLPLPVNIKESLYLSTLMLVIETPMSFFKESYCRKKLV